MTEQLMFQTQVAYVTTKMAMMLGMFQASLHVELSSVVIVETTLNQVIKVKLFLSTMALEEPLALSHILQQIS